MDMQTFEEFFKKVSLFDETLGFELKINAPGDISYQFQVQEKHLSSPGVSHGGVLAAFMDSILGMTALSYCMQNNHLCSTVEFKINYITPARLGDTLKGRARLDYTGSSLIVTSGEIISLDGQTLYAKGQGTFSQYPLQKNEGLLEQLEKMGVKL